MGRYDRFTRAFTSGAKAAVAPFDEPGPEITVSPFAPGEVTTGAGILRAITAVAGARRARANWDASQREKQAGRYRDALETQLLEQRVNAPDHEAARLSETNRHNLAMEGIARDRVTAAGKPKPARPLTPTEKAANASLLKLSLDQFDAQGEKWADEAMTTPRVGVGGKKLPPIADVGQTLARLLKTASPSEQLKYAQALGVSPVTDPIDVVDEEGNPVGKQARPRFDANGRYQFDPKEVANALTTWMATRRKGLLTQWQSENAPQRSMYQQALAGMAFPGVGAPEDDPLEAAALELFGDE